MKLAQPEKRIANQKIPNLVTAIIENVSAPIRVLTFARIEVLVQRRAVESPQRKRVFRKMRRHPIHNHAQPSLMQMIDQEAKIVRRAVAGRRRVVSADLITPRRHVWMFLERHKLDMSESVCDHVIGQQWGNLAIT